MAHAISFPESAEAIRVLAADSTRMNSQLLAAALENEQQFQVLEPVSGSAAILAAVVQHRPAVVLVSTHMDEQAGRGFDVVREIRTTNPDTRTIMLLDTSERQHVVEAFRAGARGVFSRTEPLKLLGRCIQCVSEGQIWANSRELRYLVDAVGEAMPMRAVSAKETPLSKREQEVVRCVAEGLSNREIAQRLRLTEHTVKNYLFRIFDKLGVSKRVEVVLYAYSIGYPGSQRSAMLHKIPSEGTKHSREN